MNTLLAPTLSRLSRRATATAVAATILCVVGAFSNRPQLFHSYLVAWVAFSGLSCGALVLVMIPGLTGGAWGLAIQRLAEAAMLTMPLMAVLFIPVLIGIHEIFPWSRAESLVEHPKWQARHAYLNVPGFAARGFICLGVLSGLGIALRHSSLLQDQDSRREEGARLQRILSASGLVLYVFSMNFASTDWVMSLEPDWHSTMFVLIFMVGHLLTALALMTALLALLAGNPPFNAMITEKHFHDLGKLLLTFVIIWAYVTFSQFLIIWSGNLPEEVSWYKRRSAGNWSLVVLALLVFQFLLPFFLLLSRQTKRQRVRLGFIAAGILLFSFLNVYWLIAPAFNTENVRLHWLDAATFLAVGGYWFAAQLWFLNRQPLLPYAAIGPQLHR